MKLVAFLLLSSLTVVVVVGFPDGHIANADLSSVGNNANSISATENTEGTSSLTTAAAAQGDDGIRQPRGLLKKIFGYPERVVVVEKVYAPQNPYYSGYSGYGSQYTGYGYGRGY